MRQKNFILKMMSIIAFMLCLFMFVACSETGTNAIVELPEIPEQPEQKPDPTNRLLEVKLLDRCNWVATDSIKGKVENEVLDVKWYSQMGAGFSILKEQSENKDTTYLYQVVNQVKVDNIKAMRVDDVNALENLKIEMKDNKFVIDKSNVMNVTIALPVMTKNLTFTVWNGEKYVSEVFSIFAEKADHKLCFPDLTSGQLVFKKGAPVEGADKTFKFSATLTLVDSENKEYVYTIEDLVATESEKDQVAITMTGFIPLEGSRAKATFDIIHTLNTELNQKVDTIIDVKSALSVAKVGTFNGNSLSWSGATSQNYDGAKTYQFNASNNVVCNVDASVEMEVNFTFREQQYVGKFEKATVRANSFAPGTPDTSDSDWNYYPFSTSFDLYVQEVLFRSVTLDLKGRVEKEKDEVGEMTKEVTVNPNGTVDIVITIPHTVLDDEVYTFKGISLGLVFSVTESFTKENADLTLVQTGEKEGDWKFVKDFSQNGVTGKTMKKTSTVKFNQGDDDKVELTMNRELQVVINGSPEKIDLTDAIKATITKGESDDNKTETFQKYNVVYNVYVNNIKMEVSANQSWKISFKKVDEILGYEFVSEVIENYTRILTATEKHSVEDNKKINPSRSLNFNASHNGDLLIDANSTELDLALQYGITERKGAINDGDWVGVNTLTESAFGFGGVVKVTLEGIMSWKGHTLAEVIPVVTIKSAPMVDQTSDKKYNYYKFLVTYDIQVVNDHYTLTQNVTIRRKKDVDYTDIEKYGKLDPSMLGYAGRFTIFGERRENQSEVASIPFEKGWLELFLNGDVKFTAYGEGMARPTGYVAAVADGNSWVIAQMNAAKGWSNTDYKSGFEYVSLIGRNIVGTISSFTISNLGIKNPVLDTFAKYYDEEDGVLYITFNGKDYAFK